ncbi:hypothetical protein GCM10009547_12820 [Sporichthya brevicatena]|uniref:Uncharacterized protein n=1 Tax=Sporichthya brevicatena TaxID=171442 RepID=A0ABN1GIH8_9ACTN
MERLTTSWQAILSDDWHHSSRDSIRRALSSVAVLANQVKDEGRDLGIGGLLVSAPTSPILALKPGRLVRAVSERWERFTYVPAERQKGLVMSPRPHAAETSLRL